MTDDQVFILCTMLISGTPRSLTSSAVQPRTDCHSHVSIVLIVCKTAVLKRFVDPIRSLRSHPITC